MIAGANPMALKRGSDAAGGGDPADAARSTPRPRGEDRAHIACPADYQEDRDRPGGEALGTRGA